MNITQTFKQFIDNLAIDNRSEISSRYGEITKSLNKKYRSFESTTSNSLQVGSYGRYTAINNISDLDMIYMLPSSEWNRFKDGRQSALLQEVKAAIGTRYPRTAMKGDGQVVVVSFHNHQIEVLPAFELEDGSFKHPNTNNGGSWQVTKPRLEMKMISESDKAKNNNLRPLCKMIRAWKNYHGVAMGGLLIDTLAYNFLNANNEYDDKSHTYYDWMIRDFFKHLSELKEQSYYLAPGSNQKVHVKKKFQRRAKKAHKLALEAIAAQENANANSKWKRIFGRPFPSSAVMRSEAVDCAVYSWDNTEEFIEDKFPVDIRYNLDIDCEVSQNGFRQDNLVNMILHKIKLLPNKKLLFQITRNDTPGDYDIFWKVLNRGEIARQKNQVRGQIVRGGTTQKESTTFRGDHVVECYIVQNNIVVAKDRIHVPISEG